MRKLSCLIVLVSLRGFILGLVNKLKDPRHIEIDINKAMYRASLTTSFLKCGTRILIVGQHKR